MSRESNLQIRFTISESERDLAEQLSAVLKEWSSIDEISTDENGLSIAVWNSEHYYLAESMPWILRVVASVFPYKIIDADGRGEYSVVDDLYEYHARYAQETKEILGFLDHSCQGTGEDDDTRYHYCHAGLTEEELKDIISIAEKNGHTQLLERIRAIQCVPESFANGSGWVYSFMNCKELADEDGFIIIDGALYDYLGTESDLIIPDGVTTIGDRYANEFTEWVAFASSAWDLTSVMIPSSVTQVCPRAFEGCTELTNIVVAEDNDTFCSDGHAIYTKDRTGIIAVSPATSGEVEIPSGVKTIGDYAFSCCSSLTSVKIPESVTSIGNGAFEYCYLTVYAPIGSFAEQYAKENGIQFEAV